MALSDTTVWQARITGNDYTIGDTDGLALNVTARGGKIWRFRYYCTCPISHRGRWSTSLMSGSTVTLRLKANSPLRWMRSRGWRCGW